MGSTGLPGSGGGLWDSKDALSYSVRSQFKEPRVAPAQADWILRESLVSGIRRKSHADV